MIKFAFLINRLPGMTVEDFQRYHRDRHAPLFTSIPETEKYVRRYAVSHPVTADGYPEPAYDGLTEIWFDSWDDHDSFFASVNYKTKVNPDESKFIDLSNVGVMVTNETVVK
ncbi:EthD domain-containing protein [Nocardiopsis deserti]|uniref:EthD domain-containing protein n=1 Tax=Nocardiopsis deserti TaxID=2605988 RepID=UPI00123A7EA6|nr:EthD domain-containing protein [Nocardiopsis deserti]